MFCITIIECMRVKMECQLIVFDEAKLWPTYNIIWPSVIVHHLLCWTYGYYNLTPGVTHRIYSSSCPKNSIPKNETHLIYTWTESVINLNQMWCFLFLHLVIAIILFTVYRDAIINTDDCQKKSLLNWLQQSINIPALSKGSQCNRVQQTISKSCKFERKS